MEVLQSHLILDGGCKTTLSLHSNQVYFYDLEV